MVAETFEQAKAAADLVRLTYDEDEPEVDFRALSDEAVMPHGEEDTEIGDFAAGYAASPVKLDETWQHADPEPLPDGAVRDARWWEGEKCVVHTSIQMVKPAQHGLAETLKIDRDAVHLLTRYIGGGFGGKGQSYDDLALAALGARALGRPVKVTYSRQHMMHGTIHRPATLMRGDAGRGDRRDAERVLADDHDALRPRRRLRGGTPRTSRAASMPRRTG